jgi:tryptophan synthase alpha chain
VNVSTAFDRARQEDRSALVGYLPAGFPDVDGGIEALRAMVDAGCDVIEVGLPYSDPVMDGPTIQAAAQQALDGGVRTRDVLRTVEAVAATGTPTLVMTYWNPVDHYGGARRNGKSGAELFAADLADAGGAGLITPDLTPDSAEDWIAAADEHGLDKVFLVAPSSTDARIAMTTAACRGFVYATAVMGVTGARESTSDLAGPHPVHHRAPGRCRAGRRQWSAGGGRSGVRRRGHRRLRLRPHPARPPRRPGGGTARTDRPHRGPGRRCSCVRRVLGSPRSSLQSCSCSPGAATTPRPPSPASTARSSTSSTSCRTRP